MLNWDSLDVTLGLISLNNLKCVGAKHSPLHGHSSVNTW